MSTRLPLAGAADLLARGRRARALRLGLAAALAGVLALAVWLAAGRSAGPQRLALPGRSTVLVLDVSASIRPRVYRQVDATLERAIRDGGRLGVVLFSDIAYELLPPGTSTRELEGLARYYRTVRHVPRGVPTVSVGSTKYVQAPWLRTLTSGTKISTGLELARQALERAGDGPGGVVLLSDLGDELGDLPSLAQQIELYATHGVALHVVALSPTRQDRQLFASLLSGGRGTVVDAADPGATSDRPQDLRRRVPLGLVSVVGALLVLLALNERLCARLVLRRPEGVR